ncbi:hypothetical protein D9M71_695860 [compost metagenome]
MAALSRAPIPYLCSVEVGLEEAVPHAEVAHMRLTCVGVQEDEVQAFLSARLVVSLHYFNILRFAAARQCLGHLQRLPGRGEQLYLPR